MDNCTSNLSPGTVVGQGKCWQNLFVLAATHTGEKWQIADLTRDAMRMQINEERTYGENATAEVEVITALSGREGQEMK